MRRFVASAFGGGEEPPAAETPAEESQGIVTPRDALNAIAAYGVDTAMKYGLDTGFGAVQTVCAVIGVLGAGAAVSSGFNPFPKRRPERPLYDRLRVEGGPLAWPHVRVSFAVSPYSKLARDKAVILQGRPQEGKTTLLRTSIPWHHRWNVWPLSWWQMKGLYLNGATGGGKASFDSWLTAQMFGMTTQAGAEISGAIAAYRHMQWFRRWMEKMRMPFLLPKPLYIIVDQFEELIRNFPGPSLAWADMITDAHTRNNAARIIFVVNSEAGAKSLLQLGCRGQRFNRVIMSPTTSKDLFKLSLIDRRLFEKCKHNVGLYKLVKEGLDSGSLHEEDVVGYVNFHLAAWGALYALPFPYYFHYSWLELPLVQVKRRLVQELAALLHVPQQTPEDNCEEVQRILDHVVRVLKRIDFQQLLANSEAEWARVLSNEGLLLPGLPRMEARVVAKQIKFLLGTPASVRRKKPVWRKRVKAQ